MPICSICTNYQAPEETKELGKKEGKGDGEEEWVEEKSGKEVREWKGKGAEEWGES